MPTPLKHPASSNLHPRNRQGRGGKNFSCFLFFLFPPAPTFHPLPQICGPLYCFRLGFVNAFGLRKINCDPQLKDKHTTASRAATRGEPRNFRSQGLTHPPHTGPQILVQGLPGARLGSKATPPPSLLPAFPPFLYRYLLSSSIARDYDVSWVHRRKKKKRNRLGPCLVALSEFDI